MKYSLGTRLWGAAIRLIGKPLYFSIYRLTGIRLTAVTRYVDWGQITAAFPASAEKVQKLLPSPRLMPVEITPGKTTLVVAGNNFRKILSLPPYDEFGVSVPVAYQGPGAQEDVPHQYLLTLPLTKEAARWGGAHLMGMPKFVTPIGYEEMADTVRCSVQVDGIDYLSLEVPKLEVCPMSTDLAYYGWRDGQIVRSRFHIEGTAGLQEGIPGAHFHLGNHPMADKFRGLEIEEMSTSFMYMDQGSSILYPPDLVLPG